MSDNQELVATIGKFKFLRLTADLWMAVQCDSSEPNNWVIRRLHPNVYAMWAIKKCGAIFAIRYVDNPDEIDALETLEIKLKI